MTGARGEVFDIGYQRYTGPREGRARARKALWLNGVRTAVGLGRGWPSKVLPALLFAALMGVATVLVLVSTVLPIEDVVPGHADFYGFFLVPVSLIIVAAVVAPELISADRRNGVISLYLVRPLTSSDYILGRWTAFLSVSLAAVYLPQIVLFIGLTLGATDSLDHLRDNWLVVPRFLGAGFAVAVFITTLPMAAAGFTNRRAYATVFVIGLWFITLAVGASLTESIGGSAAKWLTLINIGSVPVLMNDIIFGVDESIGIANNVARELPNAVSVAWYTILTAGPGLALWLRYRRMTP